MKVIEVERNQENQKINVCYKYFKNESDNVNTQEKNKKQPEDEIIIDAIVLFKSAKDYYEAIEIES